MVINKDNCETAQKIIDVLKEKNCTVAQSQEILRFVSVKILETSTVQCGEILFADFG